jgi:hypothetical protein
MKYPVTLVGFEGQPIELQLGMFAGPKLLVRGERPAKGPKRGDMVLRRNDGTEVIARFESQGFMGLDVPKLSMNGQVVDIAEPTKWYAWILAGLPMLLALAGGAIGVLVGILGVSINFMILRSSIPTIAKFGLAILVSAFAVVAYFALAAVLLTAIGN